MKLGRPPLLEAQKKGKITGVRLRDEERSLVEKAAEKSGQGLSEWMRKVLVNAAHAEIASKRINAPWFDDLSANTPYTISFMIEGMAADQQYIRLEDFLYQLKALQDALNCIDREVHGTPKLYYRVVDLSHSSPATIKLTPALRPQFRKTALRARYSHSIEAVHTRFFKSLHAIRFSGTGISDTSEETIEAFSEIVAGLGTAYSSGAIFDSTENIPLDAGLHENLDNLTKPGFVSRGDVTGKLLSISFARGNKFYLYPSVGPTSIACHFSDAMERKARACLKRSVRVHGKKYFRPSTGLPFKVEVESIEEIVAPKKLISFSARRKPFRGTPAHESIASIRNEWD